MIGPDYTLYQPPPPTSPLAPTILNGISALVKYIVISVGYLNPITGVYSLLSGIGADLNNPMNPFGYLYLRNFYSTSKFFLYLRNYDSRIYEAGLGGATNGQGKLVLDAKNIETTGTFKSKYYNDDIAVYNTETMIGNTSEHIKIRYQSLAPSQGAHILIKSAYAITLEAKYINLNGIMNRNITVPQTTPNSEYSIDQFYENNPDQYFEANNPFNQTWNL